MVTISIINRKSSNTDTLAKWSEKNKTLVTDMFTKWQTKSEK